MSADVLEFEIDFFFSACSLTFQFNPSSKVYGFHTHDLKWDGENEVSD